MAAQLGAGTVKLPEFSGWLARAALIDDVARLAIADTRVPSADKAALAAWPDLARAGAGMQTGSAKPTDPKALAVWLGARLSKHADPAWGAAEDAAVLKVRGPQGSATQREFALYIDAIDYRCRIAFHTLAPEETDIHRWLEGVIRWSRAIADYKSKLSAALAAPTRAAFASAADPLVRSALAIRSGRIVGQETLESAKASTPYGKALAAALESIRS
ncbi:MAG: hypothetical protein JNL98_11750 [Bryobacterales bacterium]|nr:hypothetical protein [Bryobacterales bacterium]